MTASPRTAALVAFLLAAAVAGFAGGATLAGGLTDAETGDPPPLVLPAVDPRPPWAARSAAGFTGFGGHPALAGAVLVSGVVGETRDGALTVDAAGMRTTVEHGGPLRLFRIRRARAPLAAGDAVLLRFDGDVAAAVLRVVGAP